MSGAYVSGGSFAAALYDADGKAAKEVWIPIQRAFGPLQVARIGIGWDSPMFSLGFDGGVSLGPLKIVLTELTLVLPIDHPTDFDRYELDLQGLSISFDEPPVEIAGAFAKITSADHDGNPMVGYAGAAAVVVGPFGLAALGEYGHVTTPAGEYTTMFIFAVVDAPLGGIPPYFFVTAAAAGFGYNSELIIPAFDAVTTFPLVAGLDDPAFLAVSDPKKGLAAIGESIRPRQGQYWLAAGVRFTSFELVESVALIVVEFGAELEIALLGLSKLKLPPEGHAFISIEMGIEIVIKPDEGFFGASAVLTAGSYLLAEACHITGGFAFFLWYGNNAHAGQFVLTIGGYYSGFVAPMRPDYYPDIPIVGFNWVVSDTVTIKGGGYFALTPSQVMTGGGLDLMFHAGPIRAWFIAQFDVVIGWAPFHLLAHIAVDIGISLHLKFLFINVTITLELGCNVTVWGPPTGGTVTIHLLIISFTISFGRPQDAIAPTLGWPDFQATLPAPSPADAKRPVRQNVIKVVANGGVTGTIDEADGTTTWVVRPDHFVFSVHSAIPAATVTVTGATNVDYAAPAVSFRPMGLEGMSSAQTVSMTAEVDGHAGSVDLAHDWIHAAATQDLPEAVWGPGAPPAKVVEPTSIPGMAIGLTGVAPRPPTPVTTGAIDIATAFTYFPINEAPAALPINAVAAPTGGPAPTADDDALDRIATTIATTAAPARAALFAALRRIGVDPGIDGPLDLLAANPTGTYGANPLIGAPILAGVQ